MKKIISVLLAVITACGMAGCGGGAHSGSSSTGGSQTGNTGTWLSVREKQALEYVQDFGYQNVDNRFLATPFYSDNSDAVTYLCNVMWDEFGLANTGKVYKLGLNSCWLGIDLLKTMWNVNPLKQQAKNFLANYPQRADGYLWSYSTSEPWGGPGYSDTVEGFIQSYHFDQMFEFINGVREVVVWENSAEFLNQVDTTTAATHNVPSIQPGSNKTYNFEDVSKGKTVLQKLELAVNYIMNNLGGKDGLIIIDQYENTGEFDSSSCNIWDTLCFGYKDPYEGALFLNSLGSLIDIYTIKGDGEKVNEYTALLEKAKELYDKTYWSETKGRYISTITKSGETLDFGLPFLGFMALFTGAGSREKAVDFFSWVDGGRIIAEDASQTTGVKGVTGKDILDKYNISAITNTVPIESYTKENEKGEKIAWWHGPNNITVFNISPFGEGFENGGTIFYTSFYENMARIKWGMQEDALQRLITIAKEYKIDELDRDPPNVVGWAIKLGVTGEYPENGLVPLVYVKGFMGVNAKGDGLHIEPNIPEEYTNMGSKQIAYSGNVLDINIVRNKSVTVTSGKTGKGINLVLSDFAKKGGYSAEITMEDGSKQTVDLTKRTDGKFNLKLNDGYKKVVIS